VKHKYYDIILAWAEGKPIQYRFIVITDVDRRSKWVDLSDSCCFKKSPNFNDGNVEWRIKPNVLFYRVALHNVFYYGGDIKQDYAIKLHTSRKPNVELEKCDDVARWLTDWTDVEIEKCGDFARWLTDWTEVEI
jgi:hypothetical protein